MVISPCLPHPSTNHAHTHTYTYTYNHTYTYICTAPTPTPTSCSQLKALREDLSSATARIAAAEARVVELEQWEQALQQQLAVSE